MPPFPVSTLAPTYAAEKPALFELGFLLGFWSRRGVWAPANRSCCRPIHPCAEDLVNAWAYVRSHATEVDSQIRENEAV